MEDIFKDITVEPPPNLPFAVHEDALTESAEGMFLPESAIHSGQQARGRGLGSVAPS